MAYSLKVIMKCNQRICAPLPTELKEAQRKRKEMKERFKQEDSIANAMVVWNHDILPNWDNM